MANIYDLTGKYLQLQQLIEYGEMDEEVLADTLEAIDGEIEEKADGYAKIIKNLQKDIDGLKAEEKRLSDKRKTVENQIKSLMQNLESAMVAMDKKKFKTDLFSFNVQRNAPSVVVDEGAEIPEEFIKVVTSIDKVALKKAIKEGLELAGVHMESSESLRIR